MKKTLCLILSAVFLFSLFSCDQQSSTEVPLTDLPEISFISSDKVNEFSDFITNNISLDDEGKASFIHLTNSLTYNGRVISDVSTLQNLDSQTRNGIAFNGGSLYSFTKTNKLYSNGTVVDSTDFFITDYVNGLDLPLKITFGNNIKDVLQTLTHLDMSNDFKADDGSETEMTLFSHNDKKIIYKDHTRKKSVSDPSAPFEIIYKNTYTYTDKNGTELQRSEKITLSFDNIDHSLVKVEAVLEDRHQIPVSQIPVPTPTPAPTPTPIPEITGVFYDYKLSRVPYSDSNFNIIDNIDYIFEHSLNEKTDNLTLPIFVCDTFEEFDRVRRIFFGDINYDERVESVYDHEGLIFINNTMEYREEFFKDHSLVMVYKIAGSGSNRYGSKCLSFTPTGLCVYIERTDNNTLGSDDMQVWFITVEIDDKDLKGITDFNAIYFPY